MTIARALHVLAIVHWIGGVSLVTLVILPAVRRIARPAERLATFEAIEGRFAAQAKVSVTLAGLTGFYITHRLDAWHRFLDPGFWWMHAMVLIWLIFTIVLFIAEPLVLHDWFRRRAEEAPESTFRLIHRGHAVLLLGAAITTGAAVLGAHGLLY